MMDWSCGNTYKLGSAAGRRDDFSAFLQVAEIFLFWLSKEKQSSRLQAGIYSWNKQ